MQVDEQSLRKLMRALGKPEHKWTPARLLTKLGKDRFAEILKDCKEPAEQEDLDLLRSISDALSEGETIEFKVEQAPDTNGEPHYAEEATDGDSVKDSKKSKPKKKKVQVGRGKGKKASESVTKAGPSNKEMVYKEWLKSKKKAAVADLYAKVSERVKEVTVKGWLSHWKRGIDLPACAKAK